MYYFECYKIKKRNVVMVLKPVLTADLNERIIKVDTLLFVNVFFVNLKNTEKRKRCGNVKT